MYLCPLGELCELGQGEFDLALGLCSRPLGRLGGGRLARGHGAAHPLPGDGGDGAGARDGGGDGLAADDLGHHLLAPLT